MTKSTITRERVVALIAEHSYDSALVDALEHLLAAMDSEPVACGNGCSKSKWHKMALDIDEYMNGEDARESKGRDEIYSEIILRLTRLDVLETILRNEIGLPYGSPISDIAEKIYDIKRARIYSVVPDDVSIFEAAIEECKKCDSIDEHAWNHGVLAVIEKYESCRAAMLAAAPQSPGSEPATVPGKWIPVSERMPIEFEAVIAFDGDRVYGEAIYNSDDGFTIDGYEPCDRFNLQNVTHWMPLPAAPQEVKGE